MLVGDYEAQPQDSFTVEGRTRLGQQWRVHREIMYRKVNQIFPAWEATAAAILLRQVGQNCKQEKKNPKLGQSLLTILSPKIIEDDRERQERNSDLS